MCQDRFLDVRTHVRLDARMNVRICTRHHVCQKLHIAFSSVFRLGSHKVTLEAHPNHRDALLLLVAPAT